MLFEAFFLCLFDGLFERVSNLPRRTVYSIFLTFRHALLVRLRSGETQQLLAGVSDSRRPVTCTDTLDATCAD